MDDLAQFLADRYDQAEANAREALEQWPDTHFTFEPGSLVIVRFHRENDPAHRLADIKLKRAILNLYLNAAAIIGQRGSAAHDCLVAARELAALEPAVRQLGTEFSQHPEYKQEWRPE